MSLIANVMNDRRIFFAQSAYTPCEEARIPPARRLAYTVRRGSHAPCDEARMHRATRLACTLRGIALSSCYFERGEGAHSKKVSEERDSSLGAK